MKFLAHEMTDLASQFWGGLKEKTDGKMGWGVEATDLRTKLAPDHIRQCTVAGAMNKLTVWDPLCIVSQMGCKHNI